MFTKIEFRKKGMKSIPFLNTKLILLDVAGEAENALGILNPGKLGACVLSVMNIVAGRAVHFADTKEVADQHARPIGEGCG